MASPSTRLTNTIYVTNTAANTVSVIDGSTCNGHVHSGCGRKTALAPVGISPRRIAVDELTNTVYVTNAGSNTVTMLNGRTCNGRVHRGCGKATAGGPRPRADHDSALHGGHAAAELERRRGRLGFRSSSRRI